MTAPKFKPEQSSGASGVSAKPRFKVGDLIIHEFSRILKEPTPALIVRYIPDSESVSESHYVVLSREALSIWSAERTDAFWIKLT